MGQEFRGIAITRKCRALSRVSHCFSRSEPRRAPSAAQQRPTMPLFVGSRAVFRRLKRSSKPHDWSGPSSRKARQEVMLADMSGKSSHKFFDIDVGQGDFLI